MRNATIRQLQIFAMAAKHLSFARAAEQLHLTHAAISLQIKQLEEVSEARLFDRIGKRVFLTEAGETLLVYTRQILQLLSDANESMLALKGLKGGQITLAVTSNAEYFAPGLLAEFRQQEAHVRLRLLVDNREEVTRLLVSNEVDLVIMGRPPVELDAEAVSFSPHPLVLVAGAGHPLAAREQVSIEELAGEMMIVRESGSGTRLAMETFFRERGVEPRIDMEMGSNEAIKQAVVAGLGIGFISQHILGLELSTGRLAILKVEGTPVMRRWFLVRQKGKNLSPALAAFWNFVVKFAPEYLKRYS
ncbi:MAG: LysR substrate-binding domain-containing protein [Betaproteobacteria bacterium]